MQVSTATAGTYAPPTQQKTQRTEQPEPPRQEQQLQQTQNSQQERKPAPVVNTQGQTTGRIVNTSA